ncbi:MAG: hypothetical protein JSR79_12800 [Proteobacteria bacterium]|nr:hypothetical protein [Pseudomonadota bacterium]
MSAVAPLSLVVADVAALASAAGVAALASALVLVLVSGAETGGVETGGTVALGVETDGTVVWGVDTDGSVCAMATPEVPAISAPARITNFMKIFSWSLDGPR